MSNWSRVSEIPCFLSCVSQLSMLGGLKEEEEEKTCLFARQHLSVFLVVFPYIHHLFAVEF